MTRENLSAVAREQQQGGVDLGDDAGHGHTRRTNWHAGHGQAHRPEAAPQQVIDGYWMGLSKRSLLIS